MKRRLLNLILTLLGAYGALCLLLLVFQGRLIYFPARGVGTDPSLYGMTFAEVEVTAADGVRLHGWWLPAAEAEGVVLFSHGNAGNIEGRIGSARAFLEMGLSVLLYDYRGYGRSAGRPSEEGLYLDAEAFHDHLVQEEGFDPTRLLLYGESLGSAVSVELARRRPVAGLILLSSLLAVIYVWRVVEAAYFQEPPMGAPPAREAPASLLVPTWILVGSTVLFGLFTEHTAGVARAAARMFMGVAGS